MADKRHDRSRARWDPHREVLPVVLLGPGRYPRQGEIHPAAATSCGGPHKTDLVCCALSVPERASTNAQLCCCRWIRRRLPRRRQPTPRSARSAARTGSTTRSSRPATCSATPASTTTCRTMKRAPSRTSAQRLTSCGRSTPTEAGGESLCGSNKVYLATYVNAARFRAFARSRARSSRVQAASTCSAAGSRPAAGRTPCRCRAPPSAQQSAHGLSAGVAAPQPQHDKLRLRLGNACARAEKGRGQDARLPCRSWARAGQPLLPGSCCSAARARGAATAAELESETETV